MNNYIVQSGDTLSGIAAARLGQASRWIEIADINRLQNPNRLFIGQILRLPSSSTGQQSPVSVRQQPLVTTSIATDSFAPADLALARGFLFIVFEQLPEVGTNRIIRKVAAVPRDFSFRPANPLGRLSPAEHVLNLNPFQSQYISASNRPFGAPSINGRAVLLDVARIRQAGGQIFTVPEVVRDLERFVASNPASRPMVDKLISTIRSIEGEVLIEGATPPRSGRHLSVAHAAYVRSAEDLWGEYRANRLSRVQLQQELAMLESTYSRSRVVGRVGRVLTVVGVIFTVADVTTATQLSLAQQSFRPLGAEVVRQVGGWGGAIVGAKVGVVTGALFGIKTGPGAIVTGAVGAIVFGAAGYFGADWVAGFISPN
jgi:hypothetical protein